MTDTATETVETRYGAVEIETVECASCEETVAKEDAHPFSIEHPVGSVRGGEWKEGYACPICADEGPASYPERVRGWALPTDESGDYENGPAFFIATAPLLLPLATAIGCTEDSTQFTDGYAMAVITILVWGLALWAVRYVVVMGVLG